MWLRSEKKRDLRHRRKTATTSIAAPYKKSAAAHVVTKSTRAQVAIHNNNNNNSCSDKGRKVAGVNLKATRNSSKCNNNNNNNDSNDKDTNSGLVAGTKNLRSGRLMAIPPAAKKKLNHRNLLLLDDSKENCWQSDEVTLFVDSTASPVTAAKGKTKKSKGTTTSKQPAADGIGHPNDALNHFGPINLNAAAPSPTDLPSSSCDYAEEDGGVENVPTTSGCLMSLTDSGDLQSSTKCVSECDSTTEFGNECGPSTSACLLTACHRVEVATKADVVPEVDSTTELLAGE
jgi:hypothetical protein